MTERFYLVKTVATATEENVNFKNHVVVCIHGKADETLYMKNSRYCDFDLVSPYYVKKFGYKRECDAKRNFSYNNPEHSKWWEETSEIITADIIDGEVIY